MERRKTSVPALSAARMEKHAGAAAALLRAMASDHRLMVLCSLAEGERSVGELMERVPLAQSALSQHLAVLRRERLVDTRRAGQAIYYSLRQGPALDVIRVLYDNFCPMPGRRARSA